MRRTLALAATTTLALSLAACGGDGGSDQAADASSYADTKPDQIADDVNEAMTSLSAVRLSGSMVDDGDKIELDVTMTDNGVCEGSMTGPINGNGAMSVTLLSDGKGRWVKFSDEFWDSQGPEAAAIKEQIGEKWVTGSDMEDAFEVCSISGFMEDAFDQEDASDLKVKGTGEVDGEEVVELSFTTDDNKPAVASVLASEPHYLVKLDAGDAGGVTFSEFNEKPEVEAPADDDVVNLDTLR